MIRCGRCLGGNFLRVWDIHDGWILQCLQCSYQVNLDFTPRNRPPTKKEAGKGKTRGRNLKLPTYVV